MGYAPRSRLEAGFGAFFWGETGAERADAANGWMAEYLPGIRAGRGGAAPRRNASQRQNAHRRTDDLGLMREERIGGGLCEFEHTGRQNAEIDRAQGSDDEGESNRRGDRGRGVVRGGLLEIHGDDHA